MGLWPRLSSLLALHFSLDCVTSHVLSDGASQVVLVIKNLSASAEDVRDMGSIPPLEEGTATHSSILAWKIPWTEEPGGRQSMRSRGAGHD